MPGELSTLVGRFLGGSVQRADEYDYDRNGRSLVVMQSDLYSGIPHALLAVCLLAVGIGVGEAASAKTSRAVDFATVLTATEPEHARCVESYQRLANGGDPAFAFLTKKLSSGPEEERNLAMWLLAEPGLKRPEGERMVIDRVVGTWSGVVDRCLTEAVDSSSPDARRQCEGRAAGGRPPARVRLACETLQRMGSASGAESLAASGAYGYFLRGCVPLLIDHGAGSDAVARSLVVESGLRPNGHAVLTGLAHRGGASLPAVLRMLEVQVADAVAEPDAEASENFWCAAAEAIETAADGPTAFAAAATASQWATLDAMVATLPAPATPSELDADERPRARSLAAACVARVRKLLTPTAPRPPARRSATSEPRRWGPFCPGPSRR